MNRRTEVRRLPLAQLEIRKTAADTVELRGYATVWDVPYDVGGGPSAGGWVETMSRGAANRTLNARPDVRLLVNHEGIPLARTRSGTLTLSADDQGLLVVAPALDLSSPLVQQVRSAMDRGDMDEMSMAFRVTRQEWSQDQTDRVIREFALDIPGADVSLVTYPANPATVARLRAAAGVDDQPAAAKRAASTMSLTVARAIVDQVRVRR